MAATPEYIREGNSLVVRCMLRTVSPYPNMNVEERWLSDYQWFTLRQYADMTVYKKKDSVGTNLLRAWRQKAWTFYFRNVTVALKGYYTCQYRSYESEPVKIRVVSVDWKPPRPYVEDLNSPLLSIHVYPNVAQMEVGDKIRFRCAYSNLRNTEVMRSSDGTYCGNEWGVRLEGGCVIPSAMLNHTGSYICVSDRKNCSYVNYPNFMVNITIRDSPVLRLQVPANGPPIGENVSSIRCLGESNGPTVFIKRYITYQMGNEWQMEARTIVDGDTLWLTDVSSKDAGWYWCMRSGSVSFGNLFQPYPISKMRLQNDLEVSVTPNSQQMYTGTVVTVRCVSRVQNVLHRIARLVGKSPPHYCSSNGEYTFTATENDSGKYWCVDHENEYSESVTLSFVGLSEVALLGIPIEANHGETYSLSCGTQELRNLLGGGVAVFKLANGTAAVSSTGGHINIKIGMTDRGDYQCLLGTSHSSSVSTLKMRLNDLRSHIVVNPDVSVHLTQDTFTVECIGAADVQWQVRYMSYGTVRTCEEDGTTLRNGCLSLPVKSLKTAPYWCTAVEADLVEGIAEPLKITVVNGNDYECILQSVPYAVPFGLIIEMKVRNLYSPSAYVSTLEGRSTYKTGDTEWFISANTNLTVLPYTQGVYTASCVRGRSPVVEVKGFGEVIPEVYQKPPEVVLQSASVSYCADDFVRLHCLGSGKWEVVRKDDWKSCAEFGSEMDNGCEFYIAVGVFTFGCRRLQNSGEMVGNSLTLYSSVNHAMRIPSSPLSGQIPIRLWDCQRRCPFYGIVRRETESGVTLTTMQNVSEVIIENATFMDGHKYSMLEYGSERPLITIKVNVVNSNSMVEFKRPPSWLTESVKAYNKPREACHDDDNGMCLSVYPDRQVQYRYGWWSIVCQTLYPQLHVELRVNGQISRCGDAYGHARSWGCVSWGDKRLLSAEYSCVSGMNDKRSPWVSVTVSESDVILSFTAVSGRNTSHIMMCESNVHGVYGYEVHRKRLVLSRVFSEGSVLIGGHLWNFTAERRDFGFETKVSELQEGAYWCDVIEGKSDAVVLKTKKLVSQLTELQRWQNNLARGKTPDIDLMPRLSRGMYCHYEDVGITCPKNSRLYALRNLNRNPGKIRCLNDLTPENNTCVLQSVYPSDTAIYFCQPDHVTNLTAKVKYEQFVHMTVIDPAGLLITVPGTPVPIGSNVTIMCVLRWFVENKMTDTTFNYNTYTSYQKETTFTRHTEERRIGYYRKDEIKTETGVLTLWDVSSNDEGWYSCQQGRLRSRQMLLRVSTFQYVNPPLILSGPEDFENSVAYPNESVTNTIEDIRRSWLLKNKDVYPTWTEYKPLIKPTATPTTTVPDPLPDTYRRQCKYTTDRYFSNQDCRYMLIFSVCLFCMLQG